jgi:chemotaxis protein histidine kinase CheA
VDQYPELKDFYNEYDPAAVTDEQRQTYDKAMSELTEKDKEMLKSTDRFYRVSFKNVGGLVMPIILMVTFEDGSTKEIRLPAEIWRVDANACDTLVIAQQPIAKFELDPYRETADINRDNNYFPPVLEPSKFQLFKAQRRGGGEDNPMSRARRAEEAKAKSAESEAKAEVEKAKAAMEKAKADAAQAVEDANAAKAKADADAAAAMAAEEAKAKAKEAEKSEREKEKAKRKAEKLKRKMDRKKERVDV